MTHSLTFSRSMCHKTNIPGPAPSSAPSLDCRPTKWPLQSCIHANPSVLLQSPLRAGPALGMVCHASIHSPEPPALPRTPQSASNGQNPGHTSHSSGKVSEGQKVRDASVSTTNRHQPNPPWLITTRQPKGAKRRCSRMTTTLTLARYCPAPGRTCVRAQARKQGQHQQVTAAASVGNITHVTGPIKGPMPGRSPHWPPSAPAHQTTLS
mmetsp:Transcript_2983/g.7350  ORF Transcript_2983/g.7350 Transcript_2983/m.7350 type:complete len:209 (+) Transcript_2983:848-1474(+)